MGGCGKEGKILYMPSILVLKKKVVNNLIFTLRSLVQKVRNLWMKTRKHTKKHKYVDRFNASCIIAQKILLGTVLHSFLLNKVKLYLYAKCDHKYKSTFCLHWYTGTQKEIIGMDERWRMTISMLESDYCQAGEDLPF